MSGSRVVLIGHRWVNHPRGGGYAWGLDRAGAHVEILRVGVDATAESLAELPHVPVRAIALDPDAPIVTATPHPRRPGWFYVRTQTQAGGSVTTVTNRPPEPRPGILGDIARTIGDDRGILLKGVQFSPEDIAWLAARCDITYVLVDVASAYTVARGKLCARAIVTGPEAVPAFEAAGQHRVAVISQGYRPHIWCPSGVPGLERHVLFTGSERMDRVRAFAALEQAGIPVARRAVWLEDAAELYEAAAVTLCPHNSPTGRNSFSNRLVRVMASGGVPLHAWTPFVSEAFPDVPTYRDGAELVAKARELLDADTTELRARLRAAVEPYRWDRVARRWLDFMESAPQTQDRA